MTPSNRIILKVTLRHGVPATSRDQMLEQDGGCGEFLSLERRWSSPIIEKSSASGT